MKYDTLNLSWIVNFGIGIHFIFEDETCEMCNEWEIAEQLLVEIKYYRRP